MPRTILRMQAWPADHQSPVPQAMHLTDSYRIQVRPLNCGHYSAEPQSSCQAQLNAEYVLRLLSPSLQQTSPLRFREAASSNRRKESREALGPDRMLLLSNRSAPALIPVRATSPITLIAAVSSLKIHASRWRNQEVVKIALTLQLRIYCRFKRNM